MVKICLLLCTFLIVTNVAIAQILTDTLSEREVEFNQKSSALLNNLSISYDVLTGWGLGNVVLGAAALNTPNGKENQGPFWRMNIAWGGINAIIGGYSIYHLHRLDKNLAETDNFGERQAALEAIVKVQRKAFGIAAIFDIGFLATGVGLALLPKDQEIKQMGYSIVVQSAFLAAFDATMYQYLSKKKSPLQPRLSPAGVGIIYRF